MLTYMQKPLDVREKWYLVNAEGKTLGRLAARVAGILRGDLITKIKQQAVTSLEVLKSAHAAYESKPAATLLETSRNRRVSLVILKP